MSKVKCICGHAKSSHFTPTRAGAGVMCCAAPSLGGLTCMCEGYQVPACLDARPVFGRDRLPRNIAETAPAWTPDNVRASKP